MVFTFVLLQPLATMEFTFVDSLDLALTTPQTLRTSPNTYRFGRVQCLVY